MLLINEATEILMKPQHLNIAREVWILYVADTFGDLSHYL